MKKIHYFIALFVLCSCAKIPVESVVLTEALIEEGKRMHQLNVSMLNALFEAKREKVDAFIQNEYTPTYIANFKEQVPENTDYEEAFPLMVGAIIPAINKRRDAMQSVLEKQRIKLMEKLNTDFDAFLTAAVELKHLLGSAVKVNEARKEAYGQLSSLSNKKIDLYQIEEALDRFILKGGELGEDVDELNENINSIIK
jgi:hypothetical protein